MNTINVSDVIIPSAFADGKPSEEKMNAARELFNNGLEKTVVLDTGGVLIKNYIGYLIAIENGMTEIPYITTQEYKRMNPQGNLPKMYIKGKFNKCRKEYTWQCKKYMPIEIGDKVLVLSKGSDGKIYEGAVTVTKVFFSDKNLRHRPVIRRITMKE